MTYNQENKSPWLKTDPDKVAVGRDFNTTIIIMLHIIKNVEESMIM